MPNIDKQFMFDSKTQRPLIGSYDGRCYACGGIIPVGAWNWTYNPRGIAGKTQYRHVSCGAPAEYRPYQKSQNPPVVTLPTIETPKTIEAPKEEAPIAPTATIVRSRHILDSCDYSQMHIDAPAIVELLKLGLYPFLWGNPGAGKTHLILQIAQMCKIPCWIVSCSKDMLRSQVYGAQSPIPIVTTHCPNGEFPVKFGPFLQFLQAPMGIFLYDEVGLASGSFTNTMNAIMAQGQFTFDDGETYTLNPATHFLLFADNSNLWGSAENPKYRERNDAGGAFRDRLFYWEYSRDFDLERNITRQKMGGDWQPMKRPTIPAYFPARGKTNNDRADAWAIAVKRMREEIDTLGSRGQGIPYDLSSRFMFACAKIFAAYASMSDAAKTRIDWQRIIAGTLYQGGSPDKIATTKAIVDRYHGAY